MHKKTEKKIINIPEPFPLSWVPKVGTPFSGLNVDSLSVLRYPAEKHTRARAGFERMSDKTSVWMYAA